MSFTAAENEMQCILHWFAGWSQMQKKDFFKELVDKALPCNVDTLFDSMKVLNVVDKPPSIFQCQMKLFNQWFDSWSNPERGCFLTRLREVNREFVDEFDKHVAEYNQQSCSS